MVCACLTSPCDRRRCGSVRRVARFSFSLGFNQTTARTICWSRNHLSELRGVLCPFHSAGVVFAELLSVAVQTSSQTTPTVESSHSRLACFFFFFTEQRLCPTALPPCWSDSSCEWLLGPKWQAPEIGLDRVRGLLPRRWRRKNTQKQRKNVGIRSF